MPGSSVFYLQFFWLFPHPSKCTPQSAAESSPARRRLPHWRRQHLLLTAEVATSDSTKSCGCLPLHLILWPRATHVTWSCGCQLGPGVVTLVGHVTVSSWSCGLYVGQVAVILVLWLSPWSCGCHLGPVAVSLVLWLSPWSCGCVILVMWLCHLGLVVDTSVMWLSSWSCGCHLGHVAVILVLWLSPWSYGCHHGHVAVTLVMWLCHFGHVAVILVMWLGDLGHVIVSFWSCDCHLGLVVNTLVMWLSPWSCGHELHMSPWTTWLFVACTAGMWKWTPVTAENGRTAEEVVVAAAYSVCVFVPLPPWDWWWRIMIKFVFQCDIVIMSCVPLSYRDND